MIKRLHGASKKLHCYLSQFQVGGYRNYSSEKCFSLSPFCAIVGQNGSGKTNLLVSIYHLALTSFFEGNLNHCEPYNLSTRSHGNVFEANVTIKNARMKLNPETPTSVRIPDDSNYDFSFGLANWDEHVESGRIERSELEESDSEEEENIFSSKLSFGMSIDKAVTTHGGHNMMPGMMCSPSPVNVIPSMSEEMKISYWVKGSQSLFSHSTSQELLSGINGKILYFNSSFQVHIAKDRKSLLSSILKNLNDDLDVMLYFHLVLGFFNEFISFADVSLEKVEEEDSQTSLYFFREGCRIDLRTLTDGEICLVNYILIISLLICQNYDVKIVLLDEPEAHLHPSLTTTLFKFLKHVSSEYFIQMICTTHSDTFSSNFDIRNVFHLENSEFFRVKSVEDYNNALATLGYENRGKLETFARLSRTYHIRRMMIVEGVTDVEFIFRILKVLSFFKESTLMKRLREKIEFTIFKNPHNRPTPKSVEDRNFSMTKNLDSLLSIEEVNSPFLNGTRGGGSDLQKNPLKFLVLCDQDIKTTSNLKKEIEIYEGMKNVTGFVSEPREMESYLVLLFWRLYKDDPREAEKMSKLKRFVVQYHMDNFLESSWLPLIYPKKREEEELEEEEEGEKIKEKMNHIKRRGRKNKKGKKKKGSTTNKNQSILVSSARPLGNDPIEIRKWLNEKGISSVEISEDDVDENLLGYVDPKKCLAAVFGNSRSYLKICIKKFSMEDRLKQVDYSKISQYVPKDLKKFLNTLLCFYFKPVNFVISKRKFGEGYIISDHKELTHIFVERLEATLQKKGNDLFLQFNTNYDSTGFKISRDKDFMVKFLDWPTYKMIYVKSSEYKKKILKRYIQIV